MVSAYPDDSDPLSVFTRAPANETPGERAARESAEAEAKRRSDAIDDELRREKARLKKDEKGIVKVLLLGQSESGECLGSTVRTYSYGSLTAFTSLQGNQRH